MSSTRARRPQTGVEPAQLNRQNHPPMTAPVRRYLQPSNINAVKKSETRLISTTPREPAFDSAAPGYPSGSLRKRIAQAQSTLRRSPRESPDGPARDRRLRRNPSTNRQWSPRTFPCSNEQQPATSGADRTGFPAPDEHVTTSRRLDGDYWCIPLVHTPRPEPPMIHHQCNGAIQSHTKSSLRAEFPISFFVARLKPVRKKCGNSCSIY